MDADRELLIRCLDLTSLDDADDPATVEALCDRARDPAPGLTVAAVCVWPRFVPIARRALHATPLRVACTPGGFPLADAPLAERLDDVRAAVADGADEVDVVLDRRLLGDPEALRDELAATRSAAGAATWKVILETGALRPAELEIAARAAIEAGADFLKTSTGKGPPGANPEAVEALARLIARADRPVGLKISGGIRTAVQAVGYLGLVREILGTAWPEPATLRFGASSLLDDLVA